MDGWPGMRARLRGARAAIALAAIALAAAGACTGGPAREGGDPRGAIVITTGSSRGVYYGWAKALAEQVRRAHPDLRVDVVGSSGSVENLDRVTARGADFALTTEDATERTGTTSTLTRAPGGLVALARVYDDYVHVIVRADGAVRSLADLRGRRVAVGQPGSGVALVAGRVLTESGVSVKKQPLDLVAGTRELEAGRVDAVFWSGGLPTAAVSDLARRLPLRLLPLDDVAARLRARYGVAYRAATIPPGSYGLTEPVPTVASANLLVGRPDADPAVVDALLETLFTRRDSIAAVVPAANSLDRRTAISTGSLPLHPAAAAYYRRTKP